MKPQIRETMVYKRSMIIMGIFIALCSACPIQASPQEYVILLHGLARTKGAMEKLEKRLLDEGYGVFNQGYPSREKTIEALSLAFIPKAVQYCRDQGAQKIHFVTHSMGGILVRHYLKEHTIAELGRVVMLSPPNGGSEVVDKLGGSFLFKWWNGPAGQQLGTGENSIPNRLGAVDFEVGVITGDRSINLILSCLIPGPDDGKVSLENAKVTGMKEFTVIHASHPFIMRNKEALGQVVSFLKTGRFEKKDAE